MIRIGYRDQRGEMQDGVASLHRGTHAIGIADIAGKYVEFLANLGRRRIEPAVRAHAVVMHERAHVEIPADQFLREMRSDESAGARQQYFSQGSVSLSPRQNASASQGRF